MQRTQAVVLPVFNSSKAPYLDTLVHRSDKLTTMIWGWQRSGARMVTPSEILRAEQVVLPFLYSPTEQEKKAVTHAAVSGLIVHSADSSFKALKRWLDQHRVERFAGVPYKQRPGTFYVVTAVKVLPGVIPYQNLQLVKGARPLSPNKRRGYSIITLPDKLAEWYVQARAKWEEMMHHLPEF